MTLLLLASSITLIASAWLRLARQTRLAWLNKLNLPGQWRSPSGGLRFDGDIGGGQYLLTEGGKRERGSWTLQGHDLILTREGGNAPRRYDLRLFKPGQIGLDGPGLVQRIYERQADNVVEMKPRR